MQRLRQEGTMANSGSDTLVKTYRIGGRVIEVYGVVYPDKPDKFDFYDLYEDGECINLGDPFYHKPTRAEVAGWIDEGK
jgi:hypothetical protein